MLSKLRKIQSELVLIRNSIFFDAAWYAKQHNVPEFIAAWHFRRQGAGTADPSAVFSTRGYLDYNPDVASNGMNPLIHYELYGKQEERLFPPVKLNPQLAEYYKSPLFDLCFYAESYLGDKARTVHPVDHYFAEGRASGCVPGKTFDAERYKRDYPATVNPVEGFVNNGFSPEYLKEPLFRLSGIAKWEEPISRYHKARQDRLFASLPAPGDRCEIFLVPAADFIGGGVMSFDNLAHRSSQLKEIHGREVLVATMPGKTTFSRYSGFDSRCDVFRFAQALQFAKGCKDILVEIPECLIDKLVEYIDSGAPFFNTDCVRCNVLNQNHDDFLAQQSFERLKELTPRMTMTCAHEKYCTPENRERFGVPLHLLPADIPARFYNIPYEEKEYLLAYSNDRPPEKQRTLERIRQMLPELRLVEIEGLPFDEYLRLISAAKWTLTFGEGWDAYFIQPYLSGSIGFTVYNPQFCPERMRGLPTVFESYDELPEKLAEFIRNNDEPQSNERIRSLVLGTLFPPDDSAAPPQKDPQTEFYQGNYTYC